MNDTDKRVYLDNAVRHIGDKLAPLTVAVHHSPLAAAGQERYVRRGMRLHLWNVGYGDAHLVDMELRAADGTVLRAAHHVNSEPGHNPKNLALVWEWLVDQAAFEPAQLPGRLGFWGVRHIETGSWVSRWDGPPAYWSTRGEADADIDRIANRLRPQQCHGPVIDSDWWRS